jgi:CDP-6-deoxy-D-xylo-4-hexulose-3-dehydrase
MATKPHFIYLKISVIKLIKSSFYKEQETKQALADFIIKTDKFSMGDQCKKYEQSFAKKQGCKHAVFVSSGSMANLVLLQALLNKGLIKAGDKVGVSALTWATNIMPVIQLGLVPVVIDCEISNLNVSSAELKKVLEKHSLKALFITHVLGFSADISSIAELCKEKGILLLEDTCESLGSKVGDKLLGNFGIGSTFSSYVGHHFSTIEGGMICVDDDELHEALVMARAHGWNRNLPVERQEEMRKNNNVEAFFDKYTFYDLAYNARPTEVQGFIGNFVIPYWDEIVGRREENFKKFHSATLKNPDITPLDLEHMSLVSNFAMPLIFKSKELFNTYRDKFEKNDVEIRPIIAGDMTQQPFFRKYVSAFDLCENARFVHENGFYFGNNPDLTDEEVEKLCMLIGQE